MTENPQSPSTSHTEPFSAGKQKIILSWNWIRRQTRQSVASIWFSSAFQ